MNREKSFPYSDLGNLLKRWRTEKFRSATALCDAAKFDFSYGVYSSYERGEDLPEPATLEKIAKFLAQDPKEALLVWAAVQMHSAEYKALFSPQYLQFTRRTLAQANSLREAQSEILSNSIPPSEFDNTWVFGAGEREHLTKDPWLMEFLIGLVIAFPDEVKFESFGLRDGETADRFARRYLWHWIVDERILMSKTGFRLSQPHIHMPRTDPWQPVRNIILSRALEAIIPQLTPNAIKSGQAHRTTVNKLLNEKQREYWVRRLGEIEMEFSMTPSAQSEEKNLKAFTLLILLGERKFTLPAKVTNLASLR